MAQLSDDCFAVGGPSLTIDEAVALLKARLTPVPGSEHVPLALADGRVLAHDLPARVPLPSFHNAAVDGYAVRFADLHSHGPTELPVMARIIAGSTPVTMPQGRGAVRIFTGAPMPEGADTVFMQEDVTVAMDTARAGQEVVTLPSGLKRGANARPCGEDLPQGSLAIPAGTRLQPQDIGLAAATGYTGLDVRRRLSVGVFSTGNELREPGTPLQPGTIHDANRYLIMALLRRAGAEPSDLGILPDRRDAVRQALKESASQCDLILTSGGVSTGEEDHVKAAVADVGALTFWRIAIKPGRPVAMGIVAGTPFMGLPGNPVAAFITFAMLGQPLLQLLGGERMRRPLRKTVRLGFDYSKKANRREYVRVRVAPDADGVLHASKHPQDGAGVLTSLTRTDGLLELPDDATRLFAGEDVRFLSWAELLG